MIRVVIDTNVFVSAVMGGLSRPILDGWRTGQFIFVLSDRIACEYLNVLKRPKFGLPDSVVEPIVAFLFKKGEFVTPTEKLNVIQDDPKDNMFLEAAVAGSVNWIVSGDKRHLLPLKTFREIPIISTREFLDWLDRIKA